jgi:hypothetical protein
MRLAVGARIGCLRPGLPMDVRVCGDGDVSPASFMGVNGGFVDEIKVKSGYEWVNVSRFGEERVT